MTLLLKIQKKNVLFCLPFGFVYLRGCSFSAVGFVGLARFVPYTCVQGDVKRDSWERRLLLRSALLQSMPKPTIKPTATCPCSPACPGCVALCSPRDNEAGSSFLKYSLSLSRGKQKRLLILNVPIKGLLSPSLTSTVHKKLPTRWDLSPGSTPQAVLPRKPLLPSTVDP